MKGGKEETDVEFATRLTKEAGVTVIPVSAPDCLLTQRDGSQKMLMPISSKL